MALSEVIKTDRLIIEPFSENYLTSKYVGWLNNPRVVQYSEQRHHVHTVESCKKYMDSFNNTPHYFWSISVIDGGLGHIGNINAYVDTVHRIADIGIMIGETSVWGNGYATEAFKAVINYLFYKLGLRKISAGTVSTNSAMLKIMKKAGMTHDGTRIKHYIWEGSEVDMIHMAVFKEQRR